MKNILLGIFFLLVGCTSQNEGLPQHIQEVKNLTVYSKDSESGTSIKLTREAVFKAPDEISLKWYDETITFYSWLAGIEIDDTGKVFIADNSTKKIHVFNSGGSYIKSMGGSGSGPGEYSGITDTEMVSNTLHVFDYLQYRTTRYSTDSLKVISAENVRPAVHQEDYEEIRGWVRAPLLLRNDGTYLAKFRKRLPDHRVGSPTYNLQEDRPEKYYFMNKQSKITSEKLFEIKKPHVDLVAEVKGRHLSNIRAFPFTGRSIVTISDYNYTYRTWTDDFLIRVYDPNGEYLWAIYYPFEKKQLVREEILSMTPKDDWNRELLEHAELPETWPAINTVIPDDKNRLWVSTIVDNNETFEWWILSSTGELIAKFAWPKNRSIKAVKNGYVYSCETDSETGQQKLVQYQIEMN